jgi:hypothetical protein
MRALQSVAPRRIIITYLAALMITIATVGLLSSKAQAAPAVPLITGQPVNTACEAFGPQNCLGSDDLNTGTLVEERNPWGRTIFRLDNGGCSGCDTLAFGGENNRCIGFNSNLKAAVKVCTGTTGIVFTEHWVNGHLHMQNNFTNLYLSCIGTVGIYCFGAGDGAGNYYQAFDMPRL